MTEKLFTIHVIWRGDEDDFMCTALQFDDTDQQRQAMQQWSTQDYVAQAHDAEYPNEPNRIMRGEPYDCIAIFEGDIRYIT